MLNNYYKDSYWNRVWTYAGLEPTVPSNEYRSKLDWKNTDLHLGETAINIVDDEAWVRTNIGIQTFLLENSAISYYTATECDNRFVNITGDTMTGDLVLSGSNLNISDDANAIQFEGNDFLLKSLGTNGIILGENTGGLDVDNSVVIGYSALATTPAGIGNNSTFVGYQAGYGADDVYDSVSIGYKSLWHNRKTFQATAVGTYAGGYSLNQNSYLIVAIGYQALYNCAGDIRQAVGIGYQAMSELEGFSRGSFGMGSQAGRKSEGARNVFVGANCGSNSNGGNNIYFGENTANNAGTDGDYSNYNIAIGKETAYKLMGSKNVYIGYQQGYNSGNGLTEDNRLRIDYEDTLNPLIYGEFDNDYLKVNGDLDVSGDTIISGDTTILGDTNIEGSIIGTSIKIIEVTAATYTLNESNEYQEIIVHCKTGSTITIDTDQLSRNSLINIKSAGNYNITINTEGAETIDGEASQNIYQYDNIYLYSYDSEWWIK